MRIRIPFIQLLGLSAIVSLHLASWKTPSADPGSVLWTFQFQSHLWAPLTFADGLLFVGSDDGTLFAFDPENRQVAWQFESGDKIRSKADVTNGIVTFASDDGFLYALSQQSGEEIWRFDLGSSSLARRLPATDPPYDYDYMHSSPVVDDGTVYIGSANGTLYAIDHTSGQEKWRFESAAKIRATPAVVDGTVYVGSWDRHVYAVDVTTGTERWRFDTGGVVQSSPLVAEGKVFVGSRSAKLFALDALTGQTVWEYIYQDGSWVESTAVYRDGAVYVGSSDALKLSAFEAATGKLLWEFPTQGWSWATPVVGQDAVYIGGLKAVPYYGGVDMRAGLYAVSRQSGKELWRYETDTTDAYIRGGVFASPVVVEGVVYAASINGRLYAIEE